jgi:beta-glucosidase
VDANRLGDLTVGVATSAYQIEGAIDRDGKGPSIWDTFTARPGTIKNGDTGEHAAAHYDKVADDVDLLAWLGVDLYSFSIAWPRIQPHGSGPPNPAGVGFYDRLVDLLLERGVTPAATLYHWDLPEALHGEGGWPNRDTAERFAEYAMMIGEALGDRVPLWTTLNEPWVSAFLGYHTGMHAPGIRDDQAAVDAAHHLLLGHGLATQALRTTTKGRVGLVLNPTVVWPASDREEDVAAAWLVDGVRNRVWLDPVLGGAYPADVLHAFETVADISSIRPDDLATISTPIDWLGVNYYGPESAAATGPGGAPIGPGLDHLYMTRIEGDRTTMDWPIRPDGLTELLLRLHRDYGLASSSEAVGRQVELWVTENGAAYFDKPGADGEVHDEPRVRYIDQHLSAALDARDQGVPLAGYIVWSFLDNFEWAEGYEQRFGVVYVDYETQRRIPKDSAHWLRDLLRERDPQRQR